MPPERPRLLDQGELATEREAVARVTTVAERDHRVRQAARRGGERRACGCPAPRIRRANARSARRIVSWQGGGAAVAPCASRSARSRPAEAGRRGRDDATRRTVRSKRFARRATIAQRAALVDELNG